MSEGGGSPGAPVAASLRLRLAPSDARYGQGLIPGSKVIEIFGDLETEVAIREGGDEGLCAGYEEVELLEPLFAGDFVEASASIAEAGRTSRKLDLQLFKVIAAAADGTARPIDPPLLAARGRTTIVIGSTDRVAAAAGEGARG